MTSDLLARARSGGGDAFQELTDPHRRELQVHCYRMLGSLQDAETDELDNLAAICGPCHNAKTQAEANRARRRRRD